MLGRKTVLTTGDVAKLCNVAPRTVSKWFDSGQLRGYRIPGSKDRRIPLDHLMRFMRAHGIPLNGLETGRKRILLLDADRELCIAVREALSTVDGLEIAVADCALEAGALASTLMPQIMIVDVTMPEVNPASMLRFFQSSPDLHSTALIAIGSNLSAGLGVSCVQQGFSAWLSKPFPLSALIECVQRCTDHEPAHAVAVSNS